VNVQRGLVDVPDAGIHAGIRPWHQALDVKVPSMILKDIRLRHENHGRRKRYAAGDEHRPSDGDPLRMSERLGPVALAQRKEGFLDPAEAQTSGGAGWRPYSDDTARLIRCGGPPDTGRIVRGGSATAAPTAASADALADALLERETLDEQEIRSVTRLRPEPRNGVLPLPVAAFTGSELSKLK
jgi:hypothetical protein